MISANSQIVKYQNNQPNPGSGTTLLRLLNETYDILTTYFLKDENHSPRD
jgi:hypothetical protein